jgi:hypothetical protein
VVCISGQINPLYNFSTHFLGIHFDNSLRSKPIFRLPTNIVVLAGRMEERGEQRGKQIMKERKKERRKEGKKEERKEGKRTTFFPYLTLT